MSAHPEQLERLDAMLGTATLAHETIFRLRRRLLGRESAMTETSQLLAESATIATVRLPGLAVPLRRLGARWDEESLLDPAAASRTAQEIETRFAAVEAEFEMLLARQREIAARLRSLLRS